MVAKTPYTNKNSLPYRARKRRFAVIRRLIDEIIEARGSCRIVDVGGRELYWDVGQDYLESLGSRVHITLVNMEELPPLRNPDRFAATIGNGCDLVSVPDNHFDLAHSNSVIEHVGNWDNICKFANEFRRIAHRQYIQTPYYWFPVEPHYRAFGMQFLSESARAARLTKRDLGFIARQPDLISAMREVQKNYLLDKRQMRSLFPDFVHVDERLGFITKSLVAYR